MHHTAPVGPEQRQNLQATRSAPSDRDRAFYEGKIASAKWFAASVFPELTSKRAIAEATDLPIIAYNIPSRCVVDVPNDLLRELAQTIPEVQAVKQANNDNLEAIDGLDLLAGNDDILARTMELGGTGGICVASHLFGNEMKRIVEEPDARQELHASLEDAFRALSVTTNPMPIKAALRMAGHQVGGFRLPMVDLSEEEEAEVRAMLERYGLLSTV